MFKTKGKKQVSANTSWAIYIVIITLSGYETIYNPRFWILLYDDDKGLCVKGEIIIITEFIRLFLLF